MTVITGPKLHDAFTADHEVHEIAPLGFAFSNDFTPALDSAGFKDITLNNYGWINNSSGVGLRFTAASTGKIINEVSGHINGSDGVALQSTDVTLTNYGSITSFGTATGNAAIYLGTASLGGEIDNYGNIHGARTGIQDSSNIAGTVVYNEGTVEGGVFGINFYNPAGSEFFIVNYGTIKGGTASIATSHGGRLYLENYGTLAGNVSLVSISPLNVDQILNYGEIQGVVKLGAGGDYFDNAGTSGTVFGQGGSDQLSGSKAADRLNGGPGHDFMAGGGGNDTLIGGTGGDTFYFDAAFKSAGIDKVIDFADGIDKIELANWIFTGIGPQGTLLPSKFFEGAAAHDGSDRIVYNPANGWLIYDSNGNAAGGAHHFATLAAHLSLTEADFLVRG